MRTALWPRLCPTPLPKAVIPLQTQDMGFIQLSMSLPTAVQPMHSAFMLRHLVTGSQKPPKTALPWRSVLQPHPSWSPGTQQVSPPSSHGSHPSFPVPYAVASLFGPTWILHSSCCHKSLLYTGMIHPCFCWTALPRSAWPLR